MHYGVLSFIAVCFNPLQCIVRYSNLQYVFVYHNASQFMKVYYFCILQILSMYYNVLLAVNMFIATH